MSETNSDWLEGGDVAGVPFDRLMQAISRATDQRQKISARVAAAKGLLEALCDDAGVAGSESQTMSMAFKSHCDIGRSTAIRILLELSEEDSGLDNYLLEDPHAQESFALLERILADHQGGRADWTIVEAAQTLCLAYRIKVQSAFSAFRVLEKILSDEDNTLLGQSAFQALRALPEQVKMILSNQQTLRIRNFARRLSFSEARKGCLTFHYSQTLINPLESAPNS